LSKSKIVFGAMIKHKDKMTGFKISCPNRKIANKYKNMFAHIMKNDGYKIEYMKGYQDKEEFVNDFKYS